jgi:hypothetical protein
MHTEHAKGTIYRKNLEAVLLYLVSLTLLAEILMFIFLQTLMLTKLIAVALFSRGNFDMNFLNLEHDSIRLLLLSPVFFHPTHILKYKT